jgi:peptidoglycan/xylan/chitin deacetylase (PgdA/CDA1 family)
MAVIAPRSANGVGVTPTGLERPRVLMYHGFTATDRIDDPSQLFVSTEHFREHLRLIQRRSPIGLDTYLAALDGRRAPRRSVLLTIDDGYRSVPELAAPLLAAARVPAVLFVLSERMGASADWDPAYPEESLADADTLRQLPAMGIELGVHGADHTRMLELSDSELRRQTSEARARIGDLTGSPPRAFAYPYGSFDERSWRAVAAAGFDVGFSVFDDRDRFAISRADVTASDTPLTLRIKLLPGYRRIWRATHRVQPLRAVARRALTRPGSGQRSD